MSQAKTRRTCDRRANDLRAQTDGNSPTSPWGPHAFEHASSAGRRSGLMPGDRGLTTMPMLYRGCAAATRRSESAPSVLGHGRGVPVARIDGLATPRSPAAVRQTPAELRDFERLAHRRLGRGEERLQPFDQGYAWRHPTRVSRSRADRTPRRPVLAGPTIPISSAGRSTTIGRRECPWISKNGRRRYRRQRRARAAHPSRPGGPGSPSPSSMPQSRDQAEGVARDLEKHQIGAAVFACDVTKRDQVQGLVDAVAFPPARHPGQRRRLQQRRSCSPTSTT